MKTSARPPVKAPALQSCLSLSYFYLFGVFFCGLWLRSRLGGFAHSGVFNPALSPFPPAAPCVKNLHGRNPQPCMMYRHRSCTSHDDKLLKDLHRKKKAKDRYIQSKKNKRRRINEFLVYFCTLLAFFSCFDCLLLLVVVILVISLRITFPIIFGVLTQSDCEQLHSACAAQSEWTDTTVALSSFLPFRNIYL